MINMEQVFENGDKLILILGDCELVGFKPAKLYHVTYCYREKGKHYYICLFSEFYLESEYALAQDAFTRRCASDPMKLSSNARPLEQFLEKG